MDQLLVNLRLLGWIDNDLTALPEYCERVSHSTHVPVPANYPVVGRDAFRTGTGVHAAAVIKAYKKGEDWLADRVYSGVPASLVGRRQEIEVGPMSGESNVSSARAARPGVVPSACRRCSSAPRAWIACSRDRDPRGPGRPGRDPRSVRTMVLRGFRAFAVSLASEAKACAMAVIRPRRAPLRPSPRRPRSVTGRRPPKPATKPGSGRSASVPAAEIAAEAKSYEDAGARPRRRDAAGAAPRVKPISISTSRSRSPRRAPATSAPHGKCSRVGRDRRRARFDAESRRHDYPWNATRSGRTACSTAGTGICTAHARRSPPRAGNGTWRTKHASASVAARPIAGKEWLILHCAPDTTGHGGCASGGPHGAGYRSTLPRRTT